MLHNKPFLFIGLAFGLILISALTIALTWPVISRYASTQTSRQVQQLIDNAGRVPPAEAAVNYRLALWLQPTHETAHLELAKLQIASGQADAALKTLEKAGQGSEASRLHLRTLLELGRTSQAADQAASLASSNIKNTDYLLIAFAYALADRPADLRQWIVRAPVELKPSLNRIQAGGLPLAQELYAHQLPQSTQRILAKLPDTFEKHLLLGYLGFNYRTPDALAQATHSLNQALNLNPSSIEAHELLAQVYSQRQMPVESDRHTKLTQKLKNGRL